MMKDNEERTDGVDYAGSGFDTKTDAASGRPVKPHQSKKTLIRLTVVIGIVLLIVTAVLFKNLSGSKPSEKVSAAELLDLGEKYLHELDYEQALV